ncbi:MAG: hypothetical protein PWQ55_1186 [Chloroflexota bacterium]|nr:hypothetical protein [Chloroflexota bacterium]
MSKHSLPLTALLLCTLLLSACGPAATPEPTATPLPTNTPEPEPTPTEVRIESSYLIYADDAWTPLFEDELGSYPFFLPEEMMGDMAVDNQMIQYGYFAGFDTDSNVLTLYARLLLSDVYRKVELQLADRQQAACLPEAIEDTPIEKLSFMYNNGNVGFPPGDGTVVFSEVAPALSERSYFVVVLSDPIQPDEINAVSKLALVCP